MIFAGLAVVYVVRLLVPLHWILWFDELHTYYIAQAPTIRRFIEMVSNADLNPPLIYALARVSFNLFGPTAFAVRLPSIIAYFLGSVLVAFFLRRRVGWLWAAAVVALFWCSPFFRFAAEARPYALLLAFFSLTLLSWDTVASGNRRGRGLAGVAIGNTGMMLSHTLAPFSIMPFCVAEIFRCWRRRKIDWAVWAVLLLPLACGLLTFPLVKRVGRAIYPPIFQASFAQAGWFFLKAAIIVGPALIVAAPLVLFIAARRRTASQPKLGFAAADVSILIASLLTPLLVNVALMRKNGPFWDRYCITTALVFYILIGLWIASKSAMNRLAGLAAAGVFIVMGLIWETPDLVLMARPAPAAPRIDQIEPELPFVANSALTFLELDHEESAAFLSRVFYLTDRPSSLRYAQTDLMDGMAGVKQYFPVRANVALYPDFTAKHRRFLVLGTVDRPEDWLLRKVIAEGASVVQVGKFQTPYRDSIVYEVTLPAQTDSARN